MAAKSENFNSNSKLQIYRLNMMLKIMEIKSNEPKLTQKEIWKQLDFSDSTIKRYRVDFSKNSPYKRKKIKRKKKTSETQTHSTTTISKIFRNT